MYSEWYVNACHVSLETCTVNGMLMHAMSLLETCAMNGMYMYMHAVYLFETSAVKKTTRTLIYFQHMSSNQQLAKKGDAYFNSSFTAMHNSFFLPTEEKARLIYITKIGMKFCPTNQILKKCLKRYQKLKINNISNKV